jgi:hypothetical protein
MKGHHVPVCSMMRPKEISATLMLLALLLVSLAASAHTRSKLECAQLKVFIEVHAYSRDRGGLTKQASLDILENDLALIRAFPEQPRWFVEDESDARFIVREVARVFDDPLEPELQGAAAEERCNA